MKRSILALTLGIMLFSSCKIDYGTTNQHTASQMETYTSMMFRNNIMTPAITIKNLIELDRYIYAESGQLSDEFSWHRNNIYHMDDVTFRVTDVGTVKTYGKSLFDENSQWKMDYNYERLGDNSWKINNTIITYEGRDEKGNNILKVEAYDVDKYHSIYPTSNKVNAVATTQEGPMTLYMATSYRMKYGYILSEVPEGSGVYRIETERNGKALDWMELRYSQSGTKLEFNCNL